MSKLVTRITTTQPVGTGVTLKGSRLTNQEVDENFLSIYHNKLELGGGTLTGHLTLHAAPTVDLHAATKKYVDDGLAGLSGLASDITFTPYGAGGIAASNVQAAIEEVAAERLPTAGGTLTGDITLSGTGRRLLGDFSNATLASRVLLQTSTTNGNTHAGLVPNGSGSQSSISIYSSADPDNAGYGQLLMSSLAVVLQSQKTGTGSHRPLWLAAGGLTSLKIPTAGGAEVTAGCGFFTGTGTPSHAGAVELHWSSSEGFIQSRDRSGAAWNSLKISGSNVHLGSNTYYDGAWKYGSTAAAGLLTVADTLTYYRKASGTAGTTITWDTVMSINATSDLTMTGNVTAYSDKRLKEGILPIVCALAKVRQLEGVTFYRKDIPGRKRHMGLLAQDAQAVVPEVVVYDEEKDRYGLAYGNLTALLIEAIKEMDARVRVVEEAAL